MNLPEIFNVATHFVDRHIGEGRGAKVAIECGDERVTYQQLLERLKAARKGVKITQTELARRLGKPQSFVSKYENGERRLDVAEFIEIAVALKLDTDALLTTPAVKVARSSKRK